MGLLIEGRWHDQWYGTAADGRFKRENAQRRHWITADGSPGPSGEGNFKAEAGRYHLYVSLACPWAHRTLILRQLKDLNKLIDVSLVSWLMADHGWTFDPSHGSTGDLLEGFEYLYQRYTADDAQHSGRVTVPLLWDKQQQRIVSNESAEIIRMFNSAFDDLTGNSLDFYPPTLRGEIDALNQRIYPAINNGVYRAGFATTQAAYEEAFIELFAELDTLETRLGKQRYLAGEYLTEADWRLFTSLIRFDAVYYGHFKCNLRRIEDYPQLCNWLRELYQWPGVAQTVNLEQIKQHYYGSHRNLNPSGIVPSGPALDFGRQHDRTRLPGQGVARR
jgi:putative glutathione S-transferase